MFFGKAIRKETDERDRTTHRKLPRHHDRSLPLDCAGRPMRRRADDHPRHDDRECGAARDPARPGLYAVQPGVGRECLPDHLRRPVAARRATGRPNWAPKSISDRACRVRRGLRPVRRLRQPDPTDRRPVHSGSGRGDGLGGDPRHDRDDVPPARGAGKGDRRLQLRRRGRRIDRVAGRRRDHAGDQLALDLLRQPPDRGRDRPACGEARP